MVLRRDLWWNSVAECLKRYIDLGPRLVALSEGQREGFNEDITNILTTFGHNRAVEDCIQVLCTTSKTIEQVQGSKVILVDAVKCNPVMNSVRSGITIYLPKNRCFLVVDVLRLLTARHKMVFMLAPRDVDGKQSTIYYQKSKTLIGASRHSAWVNFSKSPRNSF